jgi:hypothetical protein
MLLFEDRPYILVFILYGVLSGCHAPIVPDLEAEKQVILQLEADQHEFHIKENAKALVDLFSDDLISVNRGIIDHPERANSLKRFKAYFDRVEFVQWDDLAEPIVRFSKDGSLAYVVVDKIVVVKTLDVDNRELVDSTHFAWVSIYHKESEGWKLDCIASTNE